MPKSADERPFVLELLRVAQTPSDRFAPGARVAFTPALRTSGLLLALNGEDLKSLLFVLTFVHPNGHVQPSLVELSQALRQPQGRTRAQMRRLERFVWQGKPLLHELRRESGLHGWSPSPRILGLAHATSQDMPPGTSSDTPNTSQDVQAGRTATAQRAAGREAVIAHSRATYARPREEVEREIARANGWEWPFRTQGERQDALRQRAQEASDTTPQPTQVKEATPDNIASPSMNTHPAHPELRRDLTSWNVPSDIIERLLADYAPGRIRQQLDWLPHRNANDPARFLVAAIQKDYAAPPGVRRRQALEQAMQDAAQAQQTGDSAPSTSATDLPLP